MKRDPDICRGPFFKMHISTFDDLQNAISNYGYAMLGISIFLSVLTSKLILRQRGFRFLKLLPVSFLFVIYISLFFRDSWRHVFDGYDVPRDFLIGFGGIAVLLNAIFYG